MAASVYYRNFSDSPSLPSLLDCKPRSFDRYHTKCSSGYHRRGKWFSPPNHFLIIFYVTSCMSSDIATVEKISVLKLFSFGLVTSPLRNLAQKSKGEKSEVACFNNFVLIVFLFLFPEKVWRRTELSVLHSLNSKDLWNIHFPLCAENWQGIPTII